MEFNRVTACKTVLAYQHGKGNEKVGRLELLHGEDVGEYEAAMSYLKSMDMKPWGRGVEINTDMFGNAVGGLNEHTIQPWMEEKVFVLVNSVELLKDIADEAIKAGHCVVDIESQGLDNRVYDGRPVHHIVGFALCFDGKIGFYAPVRHVSSSDKFDDPENGNLPWEPVAEQIQRILDKCRCIYHNSSYDMEILWAEGFKVPEDPDKFDDTQLMGWLVDSNRKRISLKAMSSDLLGMKMINFKNLFPEGSKTLHLEDLHPEETYIYASSDGICTHGLWVMYSEDEILAMQKFIYKVEKRLVAVLRRMSRNRIRIDVDYLRDMDAQLEAECQKYVDDIHRLCGDSEFSIDSAKQLGEVLFDRLNIPNAGKTSSGNQWKTDRQTLEDLDKKHKGRYPALTMVVKYRQIVKLRGTYIQNLINNLDKFNDGRFGIKACGAPTGRFAAPGGDASQGYTGVNAQAVPKVKKGKPNIRKAFVARPGFVIAAIDFAGVELRIAGNLSKEPKWVSEFNHLDCVKKYGGDHEIIGESVLWHHCPYCREKIGDIHSQTSVAVFGDAEDDHRNKSKGVNFGILYGAGGKTLAINIGVPEDEGYRIQKAFLGNLPTLSAWIKKQHHIAKKTGMVKTAFGRVRLIPEMESEDKRIRSFGERTSVNTVVQGASADITKIAMVGCDGKIRAKGWEEHCRILLTVHDEIVFEVRETMIEEILPVLGLTMSRCMPKGWKIPLTVDIEYGPNWGEVGTVWKPPAPTVRPRYDGVTPLWDDEDLTEAPAQVSRPIPAQASGTEPKPESEHPSPPQEAAESKPESAPTQVAAQEDTLAPAPKGAPTKGSPKEIYEYTLRRPYTRAKWRKLEALFILAGDGKVQLKLLSDKGQDITGQRRILVDPVYFQYKALEWGL